MLIIQTPEMVCQEWFCANWMEGEESSRKLSRAILGFYDVQLDALKALMKAVMKQQVFH